ncbi:Imidazole glycerol phosphate synthase subunit HisH 1 [Sedimentisphaera cyanobacteriorum]|uniref:Imidazole glycerol phosphate synthase subunit HisH n=1 Tax=Sedimentisphaera cyanobacteriorum TaxID=1940790 RepID=A0A1Q2HMH3_9BACT|nr:imidazole glycerol phosphate synthase subunit HisH [Sedimentisphaera cyanobacteriorum]AQQ08638.1 Imidazole glycerol phosphate synthase subunit HisH 1 [Sedimentisphaera cyanobacteriorum]
MITVIDYSVGNIRSVCNALDNIGCENRLSNLPEDIRNSDGIILPGVAAFGYAMNALGEDCGELLKEEADKGKPLLGICSGYQVLFDSSTELGFNRGLEMIQGTVERLPEGLIIPHMGWNKVRINPDIPLLEGFGEEEYFYFAHSYYALLSDEKAESAMTEYGRTDVLACVQKDNIFGLQFHPEKSSGLGMKVLENFEKICRS